MAADITLASLATRTTTTRATPANAPDLDTETIGLELDVGDDRALSLTLATEWDTTYRRAVLEVAIEASSDGRTWRQVGAFARVEASVQVGRESISVAGDRYVRARWRVGVSSADAGGPAKCAARFSVSGRAVGSA